MKIAIIGCGGIGNRRAASVANVEGAELAGAADLDPERARAFAERFGVPASDNWMAAVTGTGVELVVVATANDSHAEVSIAAMQAGRHVICEKPLARTPAECERMVRVAAETGVLLKTGFNHRHSRQTWKARELFDAGEIGELVFIRGRTGHGQGEALSRRWFGNHELSGGGTFLDNGVHLLDLARWFMGDFAEATGFIDTHLPALGRCEDNGCGIFRTADGRLCHLHSSWTQWRGYLFLELFGTRGALLVNYDDATCTLVRRGAEATAFQFAGMPDCSWDCELQEMIAAIGEGRQPLANGHDGWQAVRMAHAVYEASESGSFVRL